MTRFAKELGLGADFAFFAGGNFLCGIDHEDGKLVLYRRVVRLFDIRTVHVEGLLGAEEGGIVTHGVAELGIVEVCGGWRWLWIGHVQKVDIRDGTAVGRGSSRGFIR